MSDTQQQQRSEVACILAQIRQEYEAADRGLSGLAQGTCRHDFINKKMEGVGQLHMQLGEILGPLPAIALIAEELKDIPDRIGTSPG